MVAKMKRKSVDKTNTLCWSCKKSTNDFLGCPWCQRLEPVPGWVAEYKPIRVQHQKGDRAYRVYADSYVVKECPLFLEG